MTICWLEALSQGIGADTCQGSFLCCLALPMIHTVQCLVEVCCCWCQFKMRKENSYHPPSSCSTNAKVLVRRSSSGPCLTKMHFVPAGTPGGARQVVPASRTETKLVWIESSSSFLLTTGLRWRSVPDSSTGSEINLSQPVGFEGCSGNGLLL